MLRFLARRILSLPLAVLFANFLGFSFAHLARRFHELQNPFGAADLGIPPIIDLYVTYLRSAVRLDFGAMPQGTTATIAASVGQATIASFGLLMVAFILSLGLGLWLGRRALRIEPAGVAPWMAPLSAIGLSMPSYFIGTLCIFGGVMAVTHGRSLEDFPIPLQGFGWDLHLLFPVLALMVRPTLQIAQITAGLAAQEIDKQYILAARGKGLPWKIVRNHHAFRNILAPMVVVIAGSFRLLGGELLMVEYLFAWPGIGRLLSQTLIPPTVASLSGLHGESLIFLHPELVAALLSVITFWFLLVDLGFSGVVRQSNPHLRAPVEGTVHE